jgi:hypothetical protein
LKRQHQLEQYHEKKALESRNQRRDTKNEARRERERSGKEKR